MSSFLRVLFFLLSDQNNSKILSTLRHLTVAQALAQNHLVFWLMFLLSTQFECTCSIYNKLQTIIFSRSACVCFCNWNFHLLVLCYAFPDFVYVFFPDSPTSLSAYSLFRMGKCSYWTTSNGWLKSVLNISTCMHVVQKWIDWLID